MKMEHKVNDFVSKLLVTDPQKRLGIRGVEEVKTHSWLSHLSWSDVVLGALEPPIVPELSHAGDGGNYQDYPEESWWEVGEVDQEEREVFMDF